MTFLNPAVLFGLAASLIPVVIHLLNLRKLKKVEFSTLEFLKQIQKTKIRNIKLKQWILLFLRVLIILLLVASFARPTIETATAGASSTAKTSAVFIIDNSYSMSVISGEGSSLNRSKEMAKKLADEFREGDEIFVLTTGTRQIDLYKSTKSDKVREYIDAISVSGIKPDMENTIGAAIKLLSESDNFNREVYIFSDMQSESFSDSTGNPFVSAPTENIRIYNINLSNGAPFDLGIISLESLDQIYQQNSPVGFKAAVKNFSERKVDNAVISLYINGSRRARQSAEFAPGETKEINFTTTLNENGMLEIFAELEDDDIEWDNRRYLGLFIPEKIPVLICGNEPDDTRFIKLALEGGEDSDLDIKTININRLNSVKLSDYSVILIAGYSAGTNISRLNEYIEAGGSLFLTPGKNTNRQDFTNLLGELSLPVVKSEKGKPGESKNKYSFEQPDFQHPLFSNLFENISEAEVESPEIYSYFQITPEGRGKTVIPMRDRSAYLSEFDKGDGKIFVVNSSPVLSWSNFPVKGFFAPLFNRSVHYLALGKKENRSISAGEKMNINPGRKGIAGLRIEAPGRREEFIGRDSLTNRGFLIYTNTSDPGNYIFYSGEEFVNFGTVNLDASESDPGKIDMENFNNYLRNRNFAGRIFHYSPEDNLSEKIYQARFGSELWRHFLIAALLLALVEMMIARSGKKDLAELNQD